MPYSDKSFGELFPTRTGEATGSSNERQMLDAIGGAEGFRTRLQANANGVTTMLRTKNGMPQFSNLPAKKQTGGGGDDGSISSYMESGQLQWSFPGPENQTANAPALWRLNDVHPLGPWVGKVSNTGVQSTLQPTPIDTHIIRDSIDSLAIGYPRSTDPIVDAATKADYAGSTLLKKVVCSYFPPQMFSGKLRLFMQAQYGAKEPKAMLPYTIDILGESALLYYAPASGQQMQFGFWSHMSTGLFSAAGYNYYILRLEEQSGSTKMNVMAIPVVLSAAGKAIRKKLLAGAITGDGIKKAEAYLLSDATIKTDSKFGIGAYDPGACGSGGGNTLAWGWKFNWSGSKASIVRINQVGDPDAHTLDGVSKEITISISRSPVFDGIEDGKWSVSGEASGTYSWLDGWGAFNIFVPDSETSSTLNLYSMQATHGARSAYNFSNVPIYGYYDKDDVWTTVKLSRTIPTELNYWEQDHSGLDKYIDADLTSPAAQASFKSTSYPKWRDYSLRRTDSSSMYDLRYVTSRDTMVISVGGWSFTGDRKGGTFATETQSAVSGGSTIDGGPVPADSSYGSNNGTGVTTPAQAAANNYTSWGFYNLISLTISSGTTTYTSSSGDYEIVDRWVLIIPPNDSDAVHVATQHIRSNTGVTNTTTILSARGSQTLVVRDIAYQDHTFDIDWVYADFGQGSYVSSSSDNNPQIIPADTQIIGWSRSMHAMPGTPSQGYGSMFNADISSPTYNGSMTFAESAGGKYYGTEGFNSGNILPKGLFVGWY